MWAIYQDLSAMGRDEQRGEVLGGYHLLENLAKASGIPTQLDAVKGNRGYRIQIWYEC